MTKKEVWEAIRKIESRQEFGHSEGEIVEQAMRFAMHVAFGELKRELNIKPPARRYILKGNPKEKEEEITSENDQSEEINQHVFNQAT